MKNKISNSFVLLALLGAAGAAYGQHAEDLPQLGGRTSDDLVIDTKNKRYQIGDEWGKLPVSDEELESNDVYRRTALATAKVGGATGFYLGEFSGEHVMATNNHVMSSRFGCNQVTFPIKNLRFRCKEFLGTWKNIDLTLFTIKVKGAGEKEYLQSIAQNFDFDADIAIETPLITAGFGIAENRSRRLMVNQDDDCKSFSKPGEYRLMRDPDDVNPGPNKVWSFAVGCDVSHGDSGSAMVDRNTGHVVGLIWTGRIPKAERVQKSDYLDLILTEDNSEQIWGQLNYAVPAEQIKMILEGDIEAGKIAGTAKDIILAMLEK